MCHVLVIEDDPLIAMLIEDLAIEGGATSVDIAVSPVTAMAAALRRPPKVILSDVMIIDGTGPEAVEAIRRRIGEIPVIFITATPDVCEPCGYAAAILSKPFRLRDIVETFRNIAPV